MSALARGARRSQRRFGGALEPMHTLRLTLAESATSELLLLREASIETPRHFLTSRLTTLDVAGRALSWLRHAAVPRTPELGAFRQTLLLLDRLDRADQEARATLALAEFGLRLLSELGWGLDFERCVRCGKPCESDQSAYVDAARGGLMCRACGGARVRLCGALRQRFAKITLDSRAELLDEDASLALDLVEAALRAHVGTE